MHRRLMGNSTMLGSSAEPRAQTVSPAIMVAKAGAIGIERRLQAKRARVPENTAAMPMGIASGMLWNVIISAPTRPGWQRSFNPWSLARLHLNWNLSRTKPSAITRERLTCRWRPRLRIRLHWPCTR